MSIPPAKKNAPRLPKESGAAVDPKCSVPFAQTSLASVAKGTHARRTHRPAFRGVIVLDLRQQACALCLAKNAPERPAGLRVFPEHGRQMARQTRQMGCRPSTRITQPAALQARENHVCPWQLTLSSSQISCSAFDKAFSKIQRPRTFSGNSGKASSASEAAPHKIAYAFLISCIEITSTHILSDYQIKCNI